MHIAKSAPLNKRTITSDYALACMGLIDWPYESGIICMFCIVQQTMMQ